MKLWSILTRTHEAYGAAKGATASGLVLSNIRAHMAALGIPAELLTDEELERRIIELARVMVGQGVSWKHAARAAKVGCQVLRQTGVSIEALENGWPL